MAVTEARLLAKIDATVRFERVDGRGGGHAVKPCLPPAWLPSQIMACTVLPFPALTGIISVPTLRRDGTVLDKPGYDPATGLHYVPTDNTIEWPGIPEAPDRGKVVDAVDLLLRPLRDFPYVSGSDRAAAVAAILTLLVRDHIDGPVPAFPIRSPAGGTGKGLHADVITIIGTGQSPDAMPLVDADELRKRVTALVQQGTRAIVLDNLTGSVGSDLLASILTRDDWQDRLLGTNDTMTWPLRIVWFMTGNNITFQRTLGRRVIPIDLDAGIERPEDRSEWLYPDLLSHVRAHRLEYVAAGLTIIKGFIAAGRPSHGRVPMGSYEKWDALIRAAVVWTGLEDFAAVEKADSGRSRIRADSDRDADALTTLLVELVAMFPNEARFTAAEVALRSESHAGLRAALGGICRRPAPTAEAVGYAFRGLQNRLANGMKLTPDDAAKRPRHYMVTGTMGR